MKTIITFFTISVVIVNFSYSAKAPIVFGKIDKADLEMKYYEPDSSAPAVILCDYGYFSANDYRFRRILRIKILKKEGLAWADKVFPTSMKSDIRGITYNLEEGEIVKEKLKSSSIFSERVNDDYYRMRVAMPNVKVGSVIDIEFGHPLIPKEWRFQDVIPVKWSELVLEPTTILRFRKNMFGYEPLYINTENRYVGKDMPAFKAEPYMNSIENYITKFEFDILDINIPGYYKTYTTSWEAIRVFLNDHEYFGKALTGAMYLNSVAKEIETKTGIIIDKSKQKLFVRLLLEGIKE